MRFLYRLRHVLAAVLLAAIAATPAPEPGSPAAAWPEPVPTPVRRSDLPAAFTREAPASLADLRTIQTRVEKLVTDLSPSVVAVQIGQISGSAVIISTNGLVLNAGHNDVKLTPDEVQRIKCWIDLNCPLWPDYVQRDLRPAK